MNAKHILIVGAGRSSSALIEYLIKQSELNNWRLTLGDVSKEVAISKIGNAACASAIHFDIEDIVLSRKAIAEADVVVSLIPAHLHSKVASLCVQEGKHLLTASYVSDEMKSLDADAKAKNVLLLNECGLDPGIDHMSAMQLIDKIKSQGGVLHTFESFTGGLIAPETDSENPWRYKFTWNPRNVVMAGQGTAKFLQEGKYKYIPYQQLFTRITPVSVPGFGEYEGYANRDSLKYLDTYGLTDIKTMIRGTLRNKGFCRAWNILVQLGCCDDTFQLEGVDRMTHHDFIDSFLDSGNSLSITEKIATIFKLQPDGEEIKRLSWSGLFSSELVGLKSGTPAQILEHILNKRWKLRQGDKDFIIMWHRFVYELDGSRKEIQAYLTATGDDEVQTAMAKTVGLPLGIAAKLVMQNKIKSRGVLIPVSGEFYDPILSELKELGIALTERTIN